MVFIPFKHNAQLSLSGGLQCHIDGFVSTKQFTSFNQPFAGLAWQKRYLQLSAAISGIYEYQQLEKSSSTHNYGSHGGPAPNTYFVYAAKVKFSYVGFRVGADFVFLPNKQFRILLGGSVHLDHLTSYKAYDFTQTSVTKYSGNPSWTPNPGSGAFTTYHPATHDEIPMLLMDENYIYTNFGIKPQFNWKNYRIELQWALSFFSTPRVKDLSTDEYIGEKQFSAFHFKRGYVAQEVGFSLDYTFNGKKD